MVITKDMSRLGRDYIGTGELVEKFFPEHNVRYIAVRDENKYCQIGGYSNYKDLTIEEKREYHRIRDCERKIINKGE